MLELRGDLHLLAPCQHLSRQLVDEGQRGFVLWWRDFNNSIRTVFPLTIKKKLRHDTSHQILPQSCSWGAIDWAEDWNPSWFNFPGLVAEGHDHSVFSTDTKQLQLIPVAPRTPPALIPVLLLVLSCPANWCGKKLHLYNSATCRINFIID